MCNLQKKMLFKCTKNVESIQKWLAFEVNQGEKYLYWSQKGLHPPKMSCLICQSSIKTNRLILLDLKSSFYTIFLKKYQFAILILPFSDKACVEKMEKIPRMFSMTVA